MPKETKKNPRPEEKSLGVMFEMGRQMAKLEAGLEKLREEFEVLKKRTPAETSRPKPVLPKHEYPIPLEYRHIVDTALNARFGIDIDPSKERPEFNFIILVPKEYSNMPEDEWKMKGADLRSKIVSYAEGINGVRDWAEMVFKNLGPTMQAQIVADRTKLVGEKKNAKT